MAAAGAGVGAGIPDDWEHVDDSDSFSVISLPTSEDDIPDPFQDPPATSELGASDSLESLRHQFQSAALTRFEPHPHDTGGDLGGSPSGERYDAGTTDIVGLNTPPGQEKEKEKVNNDNDLDAICKITDVLVALIPKLLAKKFRPQVPEDTAKGIQTTCQGLGSHLNRLQEILHGYARHRRLGSRFAQLPVGLSQWLEKLKLELLGLQNTMDYESTSQAYNVFYSTLTDFHRQMEGFMVVIKIDYEDFHTQHMHLPLSFEEDARTSNYRGHPRSFGPITSNNRELIRLRRELYTLKDQIVTCLAEIQSCEHHGISNSSDQRKTMTTLALSYKKIRESLEEMLSNHLGDWIDHSIAGGLTYREFCSLNPDTIRSLILQLKEVTDNMFLERTRAQSLRYENSPRTLSRNEGLIMIDPVTIDTLQATEEVLASILKSVRSR
ncbi:hypothetical protein GGR51DRAFT_513580 [Nemania sp. FL0031]|nr:hypothetical protein GGR51DRAFT_513580 [Nemania sp. FL0031]